MTRSEVVLTKRGVWDEEAQQCPQGAVSSWPTDRLDLGSQELRSCEEGRSDNDNSVIIIPPEIGPPGAE